jgi:hypothetical protein
MQNVQQTIISQYAQSGIIGQLIEDWNEDLDPTANVESFYYNVWNILTAQGTALDNWGKILGVSRNLQIPNTGSGQFGFYDGANDWVGFNQGPMNSGNSAATQTITLPDAEYLQLLLTKAAANICRTTIQGLSRLVQNLFGSFGPCFVQDIGNMQMSYVFQFQLTPVQRAIVTSSGALPHPTGVGVYIVTFDPTAQFAFNGGTGQPMGQGIFNT